MITRTTMTALLDQVRRGRSWAEACAIAGVAMDTIYDIVRHGGEQRGECAGFAKDLFQVGMEATEMQLRRFKMQHPIRL